MRERRNAAVHPGLFVTHFVRWAEHEEGESEPLRWDFKVRESGGKEEDQKRKNLDWAANASKNAQVSVLAKEWLKRRKDWLAPLERKGLARSFRARTDWRLAIGLAGPSPLETSIRFHHLYGVPVLPGSGLKGLARAVARLDSQENAAGAKEFGEVFGSPQAVGLVDVLDAIPVPVDGRALIEVDVMNPHYPRWYRKEKDVPPSDDQSPVPVFFLTVPGGTDFEFSLLCRTDEARRALDRAMEWLRAGLAEIGAGAKTAAGYGYFSEINR